MRIAEILWSLVRIWFEGHLFLQNQKPQEIHFQTQKQTSFQSLLQTFANPTRKTAASRLKNIFRAVFVFPAAAKLLERQLSPFQGFLPGRYPLTPNLQTHFSIITIELLSMTTIEKFLTAAMSILRHQVASLCCNLEYFS